MNTLLDLGRRKNKKNLKNGVTSLKNKKLNSTQNKFNQKKQSENLKTILWSEENKEK